MTSEYAIDEVTGKARDHGRLLWLVSALVAAVPAFVATVEHGGSVPSFLLFCLGIGIAVRRRIWNVLEHHEWVLLGGVTLFCTVSVLWAGYGGWSEEGQDKMQEHLRLIQFVPIYLLVRAVGIKRDLFWLGLIVGAIGTGIVAVVEVTWLGHARADGINHPIPFGNIALMTGFAALAAVPAYASRPMIWRILPWAAFIAGVLACLLSGTRGALLFIVPGALIALVYLASTLGRRVAVLVGALPVLAFAVSLAVPGNPLNQRIERAYNNLAAYEPGGARSSTSVGRRLDMWITSGYVISEHPFMGVGLGRFRDAMRPYVERGMTSPGVLEHADAHNVYIDTQLSRGLLGTVALLLVLGVPLYHGLHGLFHAQRDVRAWAYPVAIIAGGYATQGLTSQLFELGLSISFFVTPLAAALAALRNASSGA